MKVFLAHPKSSDDQQLAEWSASIQAWFAAQSITADIVLGRDDFAANIAIDGTFDAWSMGVPTRRDSYTQEPMFGAFVVTSESLGKATAMMLFEALRLRRDVFFFDGSAFEKATDIQVVDAENYAGGWRVVC